MANQSDGAIYINTKIDTGEFKKKLNEMESTMSDLGKKASQLSDKSQNAFKNAADAVSAQKDKVEDLVNAYDEEQTKVQKLRTELDNLSNAKVETKDYKEAGNDVTFYTERLQNAKKYRDELLARGFDEESRNVKSATADVKNYEMELAKATQRKKELESSGGAYTTSDTTATTEALNTAEQNLLNTKHELLEQSGLLENGIQTLRNAFSGAGESANVTSGAFGKLKGAFGVFSSLGQGIRGTASNIGSALKSLGSKAKSAATALGLAGGSTKSFGDRCKMSLKNVLKYGFAIKSLYILVKKVKSAISEGISSLAAYDTTTANSINSINNSLTRLKNSLGTAFAPILNVVAPILTKFVNMLATAISYVSAFFAALTGQSSYTKAIGVTNDYAGAVENTADAAQDAADSTQEAEKAAKSYLTSLDNINKVDADSSSGSGGSGGSGGGSGGSGGGASAPQFETVAIDSKFKELADKVKSYFADIFKPMQEAWNTYGKGVIDAWKGALESVAKTVKTILSTFKQVWTDGAGYTFCSNILQLVTLIGNAVKVFSDSFRNAWNDGGNGYNYLNSILTLFSSILSLITTIGSSLVTVWSNGSGAAIIGTILQIFTNIHDTISNIAIGLETAWQKNSVGQTIIQNILNAVQAVLTFVNGIVASTKEWAASVDFYPLLESIATLTGTLAPIIQTVGSTLKSIYETIILPCLQWIIESGLPVVLNLLSGIFSFLAEHEGLLKTITTLLVGVFAFKTISPLATGIVGAISGIVSIFSGGSGVGLIGTIQGVITLFTGSGGLTGGISAVITAMSGGGGLTGTLATVVSSITGGGGISAAISGLISLFTSPVGIAVAIGGAAALIVTHWDTIKDAATTAASWISDKWGDIKYAVGSAAETVKTKVGDAWDAVSSKTTEIWDGVSSKVSDAWGNLKDWAGEKFDAVKSSISGAWDTAKQKASDTWDNAVSTIGGIWDGLKSAASGAFDSIKSSITGCWDESESSTNSATSNISSTSAGCWGTAYSEAYTNTNNIKTAVSSGMREVSGTVETWLKAIRDNFTKYFGYVVSDTKTAIGTKLKSALSEKFPSLVTDCKDYGKQMGQAVADGISAKSSTIKRTLNSCISKTNGAISNINSAIGSIERAFTFSYSYSNPMNNTRGTISSSLSLGRVGSVPYLATGAVIPPNAPFTAVLGDQKHGTNIETPENLLRKIVREETGGSNGGGQYKFTAQINRRTLFEEMITEAKLARSQSGKNPFALA